VLRDYPTLPILFISGYTNQELADDDGTLHPDAMFLAKPFSQQELMDAVESLLD
jgi:FixJ family two-component response regulator